MSTRINPPRRADAKTASGVCCVCGAVWAGTRYNGEQTCGRLSCRSAAGWQGYRQRKADAAAARQCVWCGEQWAGPGYDSPHGLVCRSECLRQAIEDAGQEAGRG